MTPRTPGPLIIISGGQTGVDRGALDAALEMGAPCGGWCPAGRQAEDGVIPSRYPLRALRKGGCLERTLRNLKEADGTLIIYFAELEGGTEETLFHCIKLRRPCRLIDGSAIPAVRAIRLALDFVRQHSIRKLNLAGPRASRSPQAYGYARRVVKGLLRSVAG